MKVAFRVDIPSKLETGFRFGVFMLAVASAGCGATSAKDASSQLATAFCQKASECCADGELRAILGPTITRDNCVDRLLTSATVEPSGIPTKVIPRIGAAISLQNLTYLEDAISKGRVRVDQDMLRQCTDSMKALSCGAADAGAVSAGDAGVTCHPTVTTTTGCLLSKVFVGAAKAGERCLAPSECADGFYCLNNYGTEGVCVKLGNVGNVCANSSECQSTLYCNQLDGTCRNRGKLGETCAFDDPARTDSVVIPCESPLTCDPFTRVCVEQCARGHACSSDNDCDQTQGLRCIVGYCDVERQADQPCAADDDCGDTFRCDLPLDASSAIKICLQKLANDQAGCLDNADCTSGFCDPTGGTNTCRAQVAPPGTCPTGLNAQCANGYCSAGNCVQLVADNGACTSDGQCASENCVGQICVRPPLVEGVHCNLASQCTSGFCNFETTRLCDKQPLANGKRCVLSPSATTGYSSVCTSGVCVDGICADGLPQGSDCTPTSGKPPCSIGLFCDSTLSPAACRTKHLAGDDCLNSSQCFGNCNEFPGSGRLICDTTPPLGELVCSQPATK